MPVMCGFALRVSAAATLSGSRRRRSGFFAHWALCRWRSDHAVRLPEAKKRLLRALSIVPVAVLSKARLLPKAARDRHLASGSFRLVCSASLSASIFAESFSTLSHKEKLC
ncbi:unnamed protein product [Coccothraustes coccothraustes]